MITVSTSMFLYLALLTCLINFFIYQRGLVVDAKKTIQLFLESIPMFESLLMHYSSRHRLAKWCCKETKLFVLNYWYVSTITYSKFVRVTVSAFIIKDY